MASSYFVQSVCCVGNELENGALWTWGLRLLPPPRLLCVSTAKPFKFSLPTAEFDCGVRQDHGSSTGPQAFCERLF
jgi:hypothetical protein